MQLVTQLYSSHIKLIGIFQTQGLFDLWDWGWKVTDPLSKGSRTRPPHSFLNLSVHPHAFPEGHFLSPAMASPNPHAELPSSPLSYNPLCLFGVLVLQEWSPASPGILLGMWNLGSYSRPPTLEPAFQQDLKWSLFSLRFAKHYKSGDWTA